MEEVASGLRTRGEQEAAMQRAEGEGGREEVGVLQDHRLVCAKALAKEDFSVFAGQRESLF